MKFALVIVGVLVLVGLLFAGQLMSTRNQPAIDWLPSNRRLTDSGRR